MHMSRFWGTLQGGWGEQSIRRGGQKRALELSFYVEPVVGCQRYELSVRSPGPAVRRLQPAPSVAEGRGWRPRTRPRGQPGPRCLQDVAELRRDRPGRIAAPRIDRGAADP